MYVSSRHENISALNFKIPWDSNTARGFGVALLVSFLLLFFSSYMNPPEVNTPQIIRNSIPIEISWGFGDGTGGNKGNLTPEGQKHKGKKPSSDLEDARIAAKTKKTNTPVEDPGLASNYNPVDELPSNSNDKNRDRGTDNRNVGDPDGSETGTGLADRGYGKGKGSGLGDIDWGGGGNRTVVYKEVPRYPKGVNTSASIRIRFTVLADGTVSSAIPVTKADPRLEKAAIKALRRWRFNPLKDDVVMVGIIPMTFRVN